MSISQVNLAEVASQAAKLRSSIDTKESLEGERAEEIANDLENAEANNLDGGEEAIPPLEGS